MKLLNTMGLLLLISSLSNVSAGEGYNCFTVEGVQFKTESDYTIKVKSLSASSLKHITSEKFASTYLSKRAFDLATLALANSNLSYCVQISGRSYNKSSINGIELRSKANQPVVDTEFDH